MSDIFTAIEKGNISQIQNYLKSGGNPNVVSPRDTLFYPSGASLIEIATRKGRTDIVELLLKYRADVNKVSSGNLLQYASDLKTLEVLLKSGMNPNIDLGYGKTLLSEAVVNQDLDRIKLLLKYNAKPNDLVQNLVIGSENPDLLKLFGYNLGKNPLPPKHTVWQDYCSYLNATYKLVELREIAKNANICYYYRMNKRELCQALTESYEEYIRYYEDESKKNNVNCKAGNLDLRSAVRPRNFETLPSAYFIRDSDGYCYSLLDIQEALDKGDPTVMKRLKSMKTDDGQNFLDVFYSRGSYLSTFNPKLSKIHQLQSF